MAERKADRGLVVEAVREDGCALQYAAAELKADHSDFRHAAASAIAASGTQAPVFTIRDVTEEGDALAIVAYNMAGNPWREALPADETLEDLARRLVEHHGRCTHVHMDFPEHGLLCSPFDWGKRLADFIGAS